MIKTLIQLIRTAAAIRQMKRAGIFRGMNMVDRGGEAQTRFVVRHHGITSQMGRKAAVQLARTMERFRLEDELSGLVWEE